MVEKNQSTNLMVIFVGLLAALAGLFFGLDTGVISGALPFISKQFDISATQQELVVSSMMFGAAAGAIISGWLSSWGGRKRSLLLSSILFIIGALGSAFSPNAEVLISSRVILGLAIGISSFTTPAYLSEIAPKKIRGGMISMYQLMITIGILLAFISDTGFSYDHAWRWMLGITAIPAVLLFIGVTFLPESPRWLASKNRSDDAKTILLKLRNSETEAIQELDDIFNSLKIKQSGFGLFKNNSNFRRSVFLGISLQFMQQLTGINVIMYYAPKIFSLAGFETTTQQMYGTVLVGLVNVIATFLAISIIDRFGRKKLLVFGFSVMAISIALLAYLLSFDAHTLLIQYASIAFLLIFIIGFAVSAGPIMWVLCSEIQPLKGRDFGITCSTTSNWVANMIVSATFLTLLSTLGDTHTFWLYAALNAVFILVTLYFVPETKNVSLEHIEENLMKGNSLRNIGR
ncbi:sugar porter family MFS transporter [Providencia manganoxydans]|uniref:sugar porter family MFS transporter n=1 Tax=Providencia manganoxydans TaxID=2923283 RepID=UPI0032DBB5B2